MQACADDPQTARTRARALRWSILAAAAAWAVLLAARLLTPAAAAGALAVERLAEQILALAAPVAGGLVLGWLCLWRT